jgi:hypothetical protein
MRHLTGLVLAGGLLLGAASSSNAQFPLSIGNPYAGQGVFVGTPGLGYGYPGYTGYRYGGFGYPGYGTVYNNFSGTGYLAGPGTFSYSSGYRGFVAPVAPLVPVAPLGYGYGFRPRPFYGAYGFNRGFGFRPFRGFGRVWW